MERRAASYTEEEELNQRRRLLNQARKGDPKAISRLFELYQVRVYSGDNLKKIRPVSMPLPASKGKQKPPSPKRAVSRKGGKLRPAKAAKLITRKVSPKKTSKKVTRTISKKKPVKKSSRR